jgi:importin subunit alpha-6/7
MQNNEHVNRNQVFFKHSWEIGREKFAIELRKKKRTDISQIKRKTLKNTQIQDYTVSKILSEFKSFDLKDISIEYWIPKLVYLMLQSTEDVLIEVSLILCNLAADGEKQVQAMVDCNYIQYCLSFLTTNNYELIENLIHSIGNIAATGQKYRNIILSTDFLNNLPRIIFHKELRISFVNTVGFCLRNLVQGYSSNNNQIKILSMVIKELLLLEFSELNENCLWVLESLTRLENIEDILEENIVSAIIRFSADKNLSLQLPACKVIGNIVSGSVSHTEFMIDIGILGILEHNIESEKNAIIKETCWTLSNILGGSIDQAKQVIEHPLIAGLVKCIGHNDLNVQREASWAFRNIAHQASNYTIEPFVLKLLDKDLINQLQTALQSKDIEIIRNLIIFIETLLISAERLDVDLTDSFYRSGCFNSMEYSQLYADKVTQNKILNLIEEHFGVENDLSDYSFTEEFVF